MSQRENTLWENIRSVVIIDLVVTMYVVLFTASVTVFAEELLGDEVVYGFVLFLGVPTSAGFLRALGGSAYGVSKTDMYVSLSFPLIMIPFLLIVAGIEGAICVIMAAPLVLPLIVLGQYLGFKSTISITRNSTRILVALISVGLLAVAQFYESRLDCTPPLWAVTTQMHIDAVPEDVWEQVVTFESLEEPDELMFKAGLAYPTHATIEGEGPGAIRRCEFNTGTFVEPITIWDEPRLLRFDVTENPIPMKELSPYEDLSPAHLHGHFYSEQGEFRLERQPDGTTILYGTTWYRQHLWPAHYWRFWSDGVIHAIHNRVLEHIKEESEAPVRVAENH